MSRIDGARSERTDYEREPALEPTRHESWPTDTSIEQRQSRAPDSPHYLAFLTQVVIGPGPSTATDAGERARANLDAFRDAFAGPYAVDAQEVSARPMFRMNGSGFNQKKMEAHLPELCRICARAKVDGASVMAAALGRCTPAQLVRVTQALIDAGRLPPGATAEARIRAMQWEWGVGVDCAGYTARAAEAVHGSAAASLIGNDTDYFAKMVRDRTHFARVALPDIRSGDIIHLDPPEPGSVGHNVIVHAHSVSTTSPHFAGTGPFHVLTVDSSWGAGEAGAEYGGFRRDTWIHDERTGEWGSFTPTAPRQFEVSQRGPQDEPFAGAYRPRSRLPSG